MSGKSQSIAVWTRLLWAVAIALASMTCNEVANGAANCAVNGGNDVPPGGRPLPKPPAESKPQQPGAPLKKPDGRPDLWDPGDEVVPPKPLPASRPGASKGTTPGKTSPDGTSPDGKTEPAPVDDGGPAWSVLLATFSGADHAAAANAAKQRMAARVAEVRDCFIRRVPQGSVLLVGRFNGPSDPAAQAKLKEIKALVVDGQRPFAAAMLTRVTSDAAPPGPYDVRRLRERFPGVKPLYSLQVAAWSTFGEKDASRTEMRAAAEQYCKELRAKNVEAWVHHDDDSGTSVVTVGHFDHTAYDSKSTLFSAEVERLRKQFPRHLINGGEVSVPVDPRKPDGPKRPQGCQLVEIPLF